MPLTKESAARKDKRTGLAPMQHRHFATIAAIINEMKAGTGYKTDLAETFAERLAETNPKFDRERFLAACGVE